MDTKLCKTHDMAIGNIVFNIDTVVVSIATGFDADWGATPHIWEYDINNTRTGVLNGRCIGGYYYMNRKEYKNPLSSFGDISDMLLNYINSWILFSPYEHGDRHTYVYNMKTTRCDIYMHEQEEPDAQGGLLWVDC